MVFRRVPAPGLRTRTRTRRDRSENNLVKIWDVGTGSEDMSSFLGQLGPSEPSVNFFLNKSFEDLRIDFEIDSLRISKLTY